MSTVFNELQPQSVWGYFEEICQVPRPSKKEEKIREYLLEFGKKHGLDTQRDEIGNVIIRKPAMPGKGNVKAVVLQSHMDMVCEKNSDVNHDFDHDPILPVVVDGWVKAQGTTLGADDGIGMAAQLALLTATDIQHGPIECLFTVDEETGLSGAFALEPGFIKSRILLNLDSEDEGELFIGCAGGIDTLATFDYKNRPVPKNHIAYKISVSGLKGGHSGDEIHKGLGNSNKIVNRFLWNAMEQYKIRLSHFDGGNLRNAIPREAFAVFTVPQSNQEVLLTYFNRISHQIKEELAVTEPLLQIRLEPAEQPEFVMNKKAQRNLLNAIYACPHGVFAMSKQMEGMVETSTNLASVKFTENNKIVVTTSQRSDRESAKYDIANTLAAVFHLAGASVEHTDGYPGWSPNPNSEIVHITAESYTELFQKKPIVRSIHAGLECGLFLEKYPDMDMVSFGPTLRDVHSPDERINIETVEKFWKHLVDVLEKIPVQG